MAYTAIDNPELYFQVKLYTGTGSSNAITLDGDEDMAPDLVWLKKRSATGGHYLTDTVRGATKTIYPDGTDAEGTVAQALTAFGSDGFTVGTDTGINVSSGTHVAWCWKESATAGFDIVTYEGNASGGTHSHSLSAVPHFMIVKNIDAGDQNWAVYHQSTGESLYLVLDSTAAQAHTDGYERWNDTAPTSSVFSAGPSDTVDEDAHTHINYLWSEKQGFSKFGSYATNNNADGPYIFTGFSPAFVMLKVVAGNTGGWDIWDNKRGYNPNEEVLQANTTGTEASSDAIDLLSNGFKIRNTSGNVNGSGDTVIYMAFSSAPFVNSNGVPCNAR